MLVSLWLFFAYNKLAQIGQKSTPLTGRPGRTTIHTLTPLRRTPPTEIPLEPHGPSTKTQAGSAGIGRRETFESLLHVIATI